MGRLCNAQRLHVEHREEPTQEEREWSGGRAELGQVALGLVEQGQAEKGQVELGKVELDHLG